MKKIFTLGLIVFLAESMMGQFLDLPAASPKAAVYEQIGITDVKVKYSRPGVKGREGKIWGQLVPYNDGNPFPWRAGADENTVIYFSQDIQIEGQALAAGKYGFHIIPSAEKWTLIFSENHRAWGSFNYNANEDVLRVDIEPEACEYVEWLTYDFINQTPNSADIRLRWEKMSASFTVSTNVHEQVLADIEQQLDGLIGFTWQGWNQAAQYCLQNELELEKGLAWANRSISGGFGASPTFTNLQTKSLILDKLGKSEESAEAMEQAIPLANITELHFYGRALIQQNKPEEAMEIFLLNRENHPDDNFTTLVGLARGHMALKNNEKAIKYFRKAAENAPPGQAQAYLDLASQLEDAQ